MRHIVDVLIEERAETLMRNPAIWRAVRTLVYPLLGYERAISMADTIRDMEALEIFEHLSLTLSMQVAAEGLHHVPRQGRAVVMPNHPAGIADGIAVFDALRGVRSDVTFFANRDAIRVAPALADMIVPVEWVASRRSHQRRKETVHHMVQAFHDERLVVIFPSGRLAQPTFRGLVEREWQPTAMNLAMKYGCPVVPLHIKGRNSALYYLFYYIHTELRDMTLFRELLNKQGQRYELTFGEPFLPVGDPAALVRALREFVSTRLARGEGAFRPPAPGPRRHTTDT
jgi:putative hemolysin